MSETITANCFPKLYLVKPVKAQELINKVEGTALLDITKDFPKYLIKKWTANELKSKWVELPAEPWEGWFMDEL